MKTCRFCVVVLLILSSLFLSACSKSKDAEKAKKAEKTIAEQNAQKIEEYSGKYIDKARDAQQKGDERTQAIDDVMKNQ